MAADDATQDMALLEGTPYILDGDEASISRFRKVRNRSLQSREWALKAAARVAEEATEILEPSRASIRSDLVAESNRLEGYDWTSAQVREVVNLHRELLSTPVHHMLNSLRNDTRVLEALGLYRAHQLAEEWAAEGDRPREYEIRALHSLVMPGFHSAGKYKRAENEIGGAKHRPVLAGDTPDHMARLASWWLQGTGDVALDAAVVHAWLTHIHPFDDGNGRMARLLANLALSQGGYPPLILRNDADRGQYLDALAVSDDGDILPLYDLFVSVLRRSVKTMSRPDYVQGVIQDRLLSTESQRYGVWRQSLDSFEVALKVSAEKWELSYLPQGYLDPESFTLLSELNADGNGWFAKVTDSSGASLGLLWFGFRSEDLKGILDDELQNYPSIFFSPRSQDPTSVHPFEPRWRSGRSSIPAEMTLLPARQKPIVARWDLDTEDLRFADAADALMAAVAREMY